MSSYRQKVSFTEVGYCKAVGVRRENGFKRDKECCPQLTGAKGEQVWQVGFLGRSFGWERRGVTE